MCAVGADADLQAPMMLTFGPGQPARQCLNINIPSDSITEGGEVFQVNAVSLTPAACSANPDDTQVCITGEGMHIQTLHESSIENTFKPLFWSVEPQYSSLYFGVWSHRRLAPEPYNSLTRF